jgi:hypothetical protein
MSHRIEAQTVKSVVGQPASRKTELEGLPEPCTTRERHLERCGNPICDNPVEPIENGWRRTERRHCSEECRQQASIIKRAAALLVPLGKEKAWRILGEATK